MPLERTFSYDLHGLVTIRLSARCGRWRARMLDAKLSALSAGPAGAADVEMHVGTFLPEVPESATVIDKDFHVAPDYVYFRGARSGGATEVRGLEADRTVIRHDPYPESPLRRITRGLRGVNMYLEPAIAWRLRRLGGYLAHAAAVGRDGGALLIFGTNGAGKTRLALELCLGHGASLLGDDLVVLREAEALGFIEHPAVLSARAAAVAAGRAPRARPVRVGLNVMLRRGGAADAPRTAARAPIVAAVLLERSLAGGPATIEPAPPEEVWACAMALERLELNKHQRRHRQVTNFGRFLMAYEYAFPHGRVFADMLLGPSPMPAWMNVPAWRCRLGERHDPALAGRVDAAWRRVAG